MTGLSRNTPGFVLVTALVAAFGGPASTSKAAEPALEDGRYLYVASPGIRNYLEYGGHGILIFKIDDGHRFVRRIGTGGLDPTSSTPLNVKGICASAATGRLYVSTTQTLECVDLLTEKRLWERRYEGGCDRMALAPNGRDLYVPSLEGPHWHVVDGASGEVLAKLVPDSGSHNTVYGQDGRFAYLAGLKSPLLAVADTEARTLARTVGPFSAPVRPFTVNGAQTFVFVNINGLLGFEVGDIVTGKMLHRVEVTGYSQGPIKRHGCPSHGVGLTPDERELWLCDAANQSLHVFDATAIPPKQTVSIKLRDEPGWVTFSIDGKYAYPSTGEVIDAASKQIVATLTDEAGRAVQSEKMLELDWAGGKPVRSGDQFGIGRVGIGSK